MVKTITRKPATRPASKPAASARKPPARRAAGTTDLVSLDYIEDKRFELPVHPAADLFPLISDDELAELAKDIKANGLLEPIITYHGSILDGRNRYLACKKARVNPSFQEWIPAPGEYPSQYVMSRNLHRRHMTASQRATIAVRLEKVIMAEAAAAKEAAREAANAEQVAASLFSEAPKPAKVTSITTPPKGKAETPKPFTPPPAPKFKGGRARDIAAKQAGVSSGYVTDAKGLEQADPELFKAVARGDMTIPQAQEAHVRKHLEAGTLDESPLRPAVKKQLAEKINAKQSAKRVRKFSKVSSSKLSLRIDVVFSNRTIAEEWLTKMEEDKRILELKFDPI